MYKLFTNQRIWLRLFANNNRNELWVQYKKKNFDSLILNIIIIDGSIVIFLASYRKPLIHYLQAMHK